MPTQLPTSKPTAKLILKQNNNKPLIRKSLSSYDVFYSEYHNRLNLNQILPHLSSVTDYHQYILYRAYFVYWLSSQDWTVACLLQGALKPTTRSLNENAMVRFMMPFGSYFSWFTVHKWILPKKKVNINCTTTQVKNRTSVGMWAIK